MPKGEFLPRDGNIGGVIAGELEKYAGVRPALVSLAGGMEKARAEAEAGGGFFGVAHLVTDGLERFFVGVVHLDVAEEGEIVAAADAAEMRAKDFREIRIVFEGRGVFSRRRRV